MADDLDGGDESPAWTVAVIQRRINRFRTASGVASNPRDLTIENPSVTDRSALFAPFHRLVIGACDLTRYFSAIANQLRQFVVAAPTSLDLKLCLCCCPLDLAN
jgi:hypothetical protein